MVFSITGLRWGGGKGYSNAYRALNMHREHLVDSKALSLFWLSRFEARQIAKFAPDFWVFRHLVVEFLDYPSIPMIRIPTKAHFDNQSIIETYLAYVVNNSGDERALKCLAKLYYALGCYEDAIKYYRKALRIKPDDIETSLFLAEVYRSMNRQDPATRILKKIPARKLGIIKKELDQLLDLRIVHKIKFPPVDQT